MSNPEIFYLTGDVKWCKVDKPDPNYKRYSACLFMDKESWKLYKESGLELKLREDEQDGKYIQFSRKAERKQKDGSMEDVGPPLILKDDGSPHDLSSDGLIGNGSNVTLKILSYNTNMGSKGHNILAIRVNKLVVYTPPKVHTPSGQDDVGLF